MVRLQCDCKDHGFVVASLRGLLGGKNQRGLLFIVLSEKMGWSLVEGQAAYYMVYSI